MLLNLTNNKYLPSIYFIEKKRGVFIYNFLFLILLYFLLYGLKGCSYQKKDFSKQFPQYLPSTAEMCLSNNYCIALEVAKTKKQKALGLMGRPSLLENQGMLFIFSPPEKVSFWMYKTLASIDMIFVYKETVIAIEKNLQPCHNLPCSFYGPNLPLDAVIELASGEVERLNIHFGDKIRIRYF